MKVRASALYVAIIIALVIAIFCSALIAGAYYYRINYQLKFRRDRLDNNLSSALVILRADTSLTNMGEWKSADVFKASGYDLRYQRLSWGVYDVGIAEAYYNSDTVRAVVSLGWAADTGKQAAMYVTDEDRPISFSGKTFVRGEAYLPKAGIREAYLNGKGYEGDKSLVMGGKKKISQKTLPQLHALRISQLKSYFEETLSNDPTFFDRDSVSNSFRKPTRYLNFGKTPATLHDKTLSGNIIIHSDTTLTIDSTNQLDNVIISARAIIVMPGFRGQCQLLASDSINIGKNSYLTYPSSLVVLASNENIQPKITIGEHTVVNGQVILWMEKTSEMLPAVRVGKNAVVNGEVYSSGLITYRAAFTVNGSLFTKRFLFENGNTIYENYLVNLRIDYKKLSPYYLGNALTRQHGNKTQILQWLEK